MRNKLRLNVIPMLETINPSVSDTIAETARRLADVALVYQDAIQAARQRVMPDGETIDIPALCRDRVHRICFLNYYTPWVSMQHR